MTNTAECDRKTMIELSFKSYDIEASSKNEHHLFQAGALLKMIGRKRFVLDSDWLAIGKALYNSARCDIVSKRNTEALHEARQMWIDHSLESKVRTEDECKANWKLFGVNNHITIKTLAWFARLDNEAIYEEWCKERCLVSLSTGISTGDVDCYQQVWLDFMYITKRKTWYQFNTSSHCWVEDINGMGFKKFISGPFIDRLMKIIGDKQKEVQRFQLLTEFNSHDEAYKTVCKQIRVANAICDIIEKPIDCHKTRSKIGGVFEQLNELFRHQTFDELKDIDGFLFGVRNGVIDMHNPGQAIFRPGRPEDFITKCSEVSYNASLDEKSESVTEVKKWFGQVFTDRSLRHYFQRIIASYIKAGADNKFPIWIGGGDNSKSLMKKFVDMILGSYCQILPEGIITKGSNSGRGLLINTRLGFFQGIDSDRKIKCDIIKELTSGDDIYVKIRSKHVKIKPTFKITLMCNTPPKVPSADERYKTRMELIPFSSTWVVDPPETEVEQYKQRRFKKDTAFGAKIPHLAEAGLWLIVNHWYPAYCKEGVSNQPDVVKGATAGYWKR